MTWLTVSKYNNYYNTVQDKFITLQEMPYKQSIWLNLIQVINSIYYGGLHYLSTKIKVYFADIFQSNNELWDLHRISSFSIYSPACTIPLQH